MTVVLSWRHASFVIDGFRADGLAEEDPPVEFGRVVMARFKRGPDGTLYVTDSGAVGGPVTVKAAPTGPLAKWLVQRWAEHARGESRVFSATFGDTRNGFSLQMEGGVLIEAPPIITPDTTYEAMFEFEKMVPSVDAMNVTPSPSLT